MKVSVVTPNYNGLKFFKPYFESLAIQNSFIEEIIIVDNGSTDGSIEFLHDLADSNYPIPIRIIENDDNLGFAPAVNQGIELAKSEYVYSINNDLEVEENAIESLILAMDESITKNENPFSIQSKMIQYHNKDLIDDAGDEYNLLGWTKKLGDGQPVSRFNEKKEIFSSCAGAALYRKSVLEELGCFDDNFFAYVEDIDLSYRAQINGYRNFFNPDSIVYHYGSATSGSRYNEFKVRLAARNNVWLVYKNQPIPQKIINFIFLFCGFLIKYLFFVRKGFGSVYLSGLKEGLRTRNKIKKTEFKWSNWKNYFKIEWKLIKNTVNYLRK
ncbi:glycosyltransferase family 2 protein [uncultured Methanobrevibacter sp.]|uniref:glycosyltransferase family 2 protein n=1 Tax=uncultured Methanobrevibacter sp. TaxID=253161 RepID=UPI0026260C6B